VRNEVTKGGAYVLAVTGLKAEAGIARLLPRTEAVAGGGNCAALAGVIADAVTPDCAGIISFGLAGALLPGLRPGALIVASEVIHERDRYSTGLAWSARLMRAAPHARLALIAGSDEPLVSRAGKQALYAATGAAAVDMESHAAARAAAARGLPFAVFRVIADPQERSLPQAALAGMREDGSTDAGAVMRALVQDPAQAGGLMRVAADAGRAFFALLRCHRRLGPGFGFFDLS
jgi:hopanoid-associated phosphorylase